MEALKPSIYKICMGFGIGPYGRRSESEREKERESERPKKCVSVVLTLHITITHNFTIKQNIYSKI